MMAIDILASDESAARKLVILTVDDDPNNLSVLRDCLAECDYTVLVAEDGESAVLRADYARPDLILLDIMMPGIDGYETCRRLKARESTREIPVIFMTALAEIGHKVKGLEAGGVDYITKPFQREELLARISVHLQISELTRRLQDANENLERRIVERTMDLSIANSELEEEIAERQAAQEMLQEQAAVLEEEIEERRMAQDALLKSERKFRAIFNQTFQFMGLLTPEGILLEANQTALDFCAAEESSVLGLHFWDTPWWTYSPELRLKLREAVATAASGKFVRFEAIHQGEDGKTRNIDFSLKPVTDEGGQVVLLIPEGRDITATKKLERELRQSQKMEAIGTLAGGIAHDFNNILMAIIGYTDMAQSKLSIPGAAARDLARVQEAGLRAKELVGRILTFSRMSEQEGRPVQVAPLIGEVFKLLRSTLPSTIEIRQQIAVSKNGDTIKADPTQLHQVLMNLATNAAHAMRAGGGVLSVTLSEAYADAALISLHSDLTPGPYLRLTVSDTGHGMEARVRERIFDPYFTTKPVGEGTGMGLAVVQGIIKSHGGAIGVQSAPGKGTSIDIFLPRIAAENGHEVQAAEPVRGGNERILFVDDEQALVELGQELLQDLGYHVTTETSSSKALEMFRTKPDAFDLVISDMTMPGLTGRELARELLAIRPDIPIIMCSGLTEFLNEGEAREAGVRQFLMKPYSAGSLATAIRKLL